MTPPLFKENQMINALRRVGLGLAALLLVVAPCAARAQPAIGPTVTTAAASSLALGPGPLNLYGFSGYSTVSGWFLVFNATSAPADGAVTPVDFYPYTAAQAFAVDYSGAPLRGSTGLTIVFSTTGPYTKTASATASISAKVQ
jgi:hypothetical protein